MADAVNQCFPQVLEQEFSNGEYPGQGRRFYSQKGEFS